MTSCVADFFDRLAPRYDAMWTDTDVGRLQRAAVWRHIDPLVRPASRVLDLGCGTGEDALHFEQRGAHVDAIDVSPEMVRMAQVKDVKARVLPLERLSELGGEYDLVISNFGAFNCVPDLWAHRESLGHVVQPRGFLAICVMNSFCLWETAYFALRGQFSEAKRRWSGRTQKSSQWAVFYQSKSAICSRLAPHFQLKADIGIGMSVPPSYVEGLPPLLLRTLGSVDASIERLPVMRSMGDHRLLIFKRV